MIAARLDAFTGSLRVIAADLNPQEYMAHLYAQDEIESALIHLENASRILRERETLETARAFGGGK